MAHVRRISMVFLALALLSPLVACTEEWTKVGFESEQYTVAQGEALALKLVGTQQISAGCALNAPEVKQIDQTEFVTEWKIEPAEGASIADDGTFTASQPGQYRVTAVHGDTDYTTIVSVGPSGEVKVGPAEDSEEDSDTEETEQPTPPADEDPLSGDWAWTGILESNGTFSPGTTAYTFTFKKEGDGWALYYQETRICPVTFNGTDISFQTEIFGKAKYTGTLSGDTITGTQSHDKGDGTYYDTAWNATRVK